VFGQHSFHYAHISKVIFSGTDEELWTSDDPYTMISLRCRDERPTTGRPMTVCGRPIHVGRHRSSVALLTKEVVMPRQKTTMSELRVGVLVVATVTILIIFI